MNFILSLSKRIVLGISIALLVASSLVFNAAPAAAATYEVTMGTDGFQLAFEPNKITAKPGDTIKFVNNKLAPHNVVFAQDPLKSAGMASANLLYKPGETYEVDIPSDTPAGTYDFYCTPHRGAGMQGKLTVQ
jgi:plastocyanin